MLSILLLKSTMVIFFIFLLTSKTYSKKSLHTVHRLSVHNSNFIESAKLGKVLSIAYKMAKSDAVCVN